MSVADQQQASPQRASVLLEVGTIGVEGFFFEVYKLDRAAPNSMPDKRQVSAWTVKARLLLLKQFVAVL
jgi:hypothetical protein